MIRFALALLALLLFVPVAQAASFDCAKAGTSFEKAICSSPDLSKQDEVLAQAYATALGGLSADAAAAVKASQHNWLDYAARICSDDAQPIKGEYTADQSTCLGGEFTTRIRELEASKMQGGYRFYPVEKFLVEKDPDAEADSYNKVATKHVLTVKIDRDDDLAAAFNAMTEQVQQANDEQMGEDSHLFCTRQLRHEPRAFPDRGEAAAGDVRRLQGQRLGEEVRQAGDREGQSRSRRRVAGRRYRRQPHQGHR
jgi:uncharacterized protein